jgi:hypothetical protein
MRCTLCNILKWYTEKSVYLNVKGISLSCTEPELYRNITLF